MGARQQPQAGREQPQAGQDGAAKGLSASIPVSHALPLHPTRSSTACWRGGVQDEHQGLFLSPVQALSQPRAGPEVRQGLCLRILAKCRSHGLWMLAATTGEAALPRQDGVAAGAGQPGDPQTGQTPARSAEGPARLVMDSPPFPFGMRRTLTHGVPMGLPLSQACLKERLPRGERQVWVRSVFLTLLLCRSPSLPSACSCLPGLLVAEKLQSPRS